jgi:RNA polymerase sigma-70 factor, ECF subfamily
LGRDATATKLAATTISPHVWPYTPCYFSSICAKSGILDRAENSCKLLASSFVDKLGLVLPLIHQRVREQLMSSPSGDPLRDGLAKGREEAFADLFERYADRLFQVALAILGRREDAEDAVQDVFVGLARSRRHLGKVENWPAYLLAALRRAAGKLGGARNASRVESGDFQNLPARESRAVDTEQSLRLERSLGALPPEQRELIALKLDAGLTFAEIANLLGISPNTAASRYRYALEKLRTSLLE